jgi:hypothetical protein
MHFKNRLHVYIWFICGLFNDAVSRSDYINDMEGSGRVDLTLLLLRLWRRLLTNGQEVFIMKTVVATYCFKLLSRGFPRWNESYENIWHKAMDHPNIKQ